MDLTKKERFNAVGESLSSGLLSVAAADELFLMFTWKGIAPCNTIGITQQTFDVHARKQLQNQSSQSSAR